MHPTRKQVAFLNYLGYADASEYTKDQAHDLISQLVECDDTEIQRRCAEWQTARFALYPDIYKQDQEWMNETFHEPFRHFVRERIAGASARLTHQRIADVIDSLHDENPIWWRTRGRNEVLFDRLAKLYPQCCDGTRPKPRIYKPRSKPTPTLSASTSAASRSGCASVLVIGLVILIVTCVLRQWI
jgi:hypothetical protein